MDEGGQGTVPLSDHFFFSPNELVLDFKKEDTVHSLFVKDVFWSERVSLSHHCSFTTRAMGAAELGPSKLREVDIYKNTTRHC